VASSFIFCLKMIDRTFLDETNIDQLVREVKIQIVIDHPNIVHLYAFFVDEAYVYLLLEPCLGGNLFKLMGKNAKNCLSEKEAKKYVKEIGKAVEYLHKLNVIHRDIKPENVLLHEVLPL
jgi:serine/threonine protein kinase